VSGVEGDVMAYDEDSTIQSGNLRCEYFGQWGSHDQMMPKAEMLIGDWFVDEFGNQSREITAREATEKVQVQAPLDPDRRTRQMRTAAARLAQLAAI
jgi:hypothetical protein